MARRCQPWLGTFVEVRAVFANPRRSGEGLDEAFAAIGRVHRLMSRHEEHGDIARLNRAAPGEPVRVSASTAEVLSLALDFFHASLGVFNVCRPPVACRLEPDNALTAPFAVEADSVTRRVDGTIDLDGLAKGYAVDRAVAALQTAGAICGCVNAGGDLRVFGSDEEVLHVVHPDQPGTMMAVASLRDCAAATSYFGRRTPRLADAELFDGRDGVTKRRGLVTVLAPDCVMADAMTKVAALMGESSRPILERFRAEAVFRSAREPAVWKDAA